MIRPERTIPTRWSASCGRRESNRSRHAVGIARSPRQTHDGRKLSRYKRRWKTERPFAWLHTLRRLVSRDERRAENYLGFV